MNMQEIDIRVGWQMALEATLPLAGSWWCFFSSWPSADGRGPCLGGVGRRTWDRTAREGSSAIDERARVFRRSATRSGTGIVTFVRVAIHLPNPCVGYRFACSGGNGLRLRALGFIGNTVTARLGDALFAI
jgi:hypothetical protein